MSLATFIVESVVGGDTPRAASEILYNVIIQEDGKPPKTLPNVAPSNPRPPEVFDTVPYKPGHVGTAHRIGNVYHIEMHEYFDAEECPDR